ncbi:unnamed protein product, partial [Didymodactylos carnosus]
LMKATQMDVNLKLFIFILIIILYTVHSSYVQQNQNSDDILISKFRSIFDDMHNVERRNNYRHEKAFKKDLRWNIVRRDSNVEVIKIGTLAPSASPWGQVFKVWSEAVKTKSNGKLELQFFYNGQQGDEAAMIGKMKAGQLDGAGVTAVGLSKIYRPILALQMPGLFKTWSQLDIARKAMKADFENGTKNAGFSILGWGDVGAVHRFSKGFAVRTPDDFQSKKPYVWRDDPMEMILYQVIGGVTPVPLNIPEVLPRLNSGAINIVNAPSLVAEQFQWSSKLNYIDGNVNAMAIGALVISSKRLDTLTPDLRQIILDTGKVAADALTTRIRDEDNAAFTRLTNMPARSHDLYKSRPRYNQDSNRDIVASRSGYITKHVRNVLKLIVEAATADFSVLKYEFKDDHCLRTEHPI